MRMFLFASLWLSISLLTNGQEAISLSGKVTDTENVGIAYVSIYNSDKQGEISDEQGNFTIKNYSDSVTFRAVGYKDLRISFNDLKRNSHVKLEAKVVELSGITVSSKKTIWLGYSGEKEVVTSFLLKSVGKSENGILIKNPGYIAAFLKTVKVKVGFEGSPKLPYRINIYAVDKEGFPIENILKKDIVFTPKSRKMKWYQFRLDDQQIEMPEYGVCIALEFLNPSTKEYTLNKKYSPVRLGFFSTMYRHLARMDEYIDWHYSNASIPAISLEISL